MKPIQAPDLFPNRAQYNAFRPSDHLRNSLGHPPMKTRRIAEERPVNTKTTMKPREIGWFLIIILDLESTIFSSKFIFKPSTI